MQIAIDGPSGSGKSTVARLVAARLGIVYIDTGALYRAVGFLGKNFGAGVDNEAALLSALDFVSLSLKFYNGVQHVYLNGQDIGAALRTAEAGVAASAVARFEGVRQRVVGLIRTASAGQSVVMDGRDIGTVVLPDAPVKVFLTASVEARAARRVGELLALGEQADIDEIKAQIQARDEQDISRAHAPLKQADDAVLVDCTELSIEETVEAILKIIKEKGLM